MTYVGVNACRTSEREKWSSHQASEAHLGWWFGVTIDRAIMPADTVAHMMPHLSEMDEGAQWMP